MSYKLVLTTCPDLPTAHQIAEGLVSEKVAACVNIFPSMVSVYHWQDKIEQSTECQLFIKTNERNWPQVQSYITEVHPYDVPEIICLPIEDGHASYLSWIEENTK
jgi:periplasmic divalent cation tolerance protein